MTAALVAHSCEIPCKNGERITNVAGRVALRRFRQSLAYCVTLAKHIVSSALVSSSVKQGTEGSQRILSALLIFTSSSIQQTVFEHYSRYCRYKGF